MDKRSDTGQSRNGEHKRRPKTAAAEFVTGDSRAVNEHLVDGPEEPEEGQNPEDKRNKSRQDRS